MEIRLTWGRSFLATLTSWLVLACSAGSGAPADGTSQTRFLMSVYQREMIDAIGSAVVPPFDHGIAQDSVWDKGCRVATFTLSSAKGSLLVVGVDQDTVTPVRLGERFAAWDSAGRTIVENWQKLEQEKEILIAPRDKGGNQFYSREVVRNPLGIGEPLGVTPRTGEAGSDTNMSVVEPRTREGEEITRFDLIAAHELGHQLSLLGNPNPGMLMRDDVMQIGETLTADECAQARDYGNSKGYFF